MKIRMKSSGEGSGFGAFEAGDELEITAATAKTLVDRGLAEYVDIKKDKKEAMSHE